MTKSSREGFGRFVLVVAVLSLLAVAFESTAHTAAAVTTVTAYKAQVPVNVTAPYQPSEWSDTLQFSEKSSEMAVAFKQNGTGLLFMMRWNESSTACYDTYCFGGIELGYLNNTEEMGTPSTPTIMILVSQSSTNHVDEFVSTGDQTPSAVEGYGYSTQSTCGLDVISNEYIATCYRPFALHNASPYDPFPSLVAGSPIEIAFAVGEFTVPGLHDASDMSTYVLQISNSLYTATSTASSSTSSSTTVAASNETSSSSTSSSASSKSSSSETTTSTTSIITTSAPSTPSASVYAEELAVIVVGFSVLMLVVLTKYRSR